MLLLSFFCHLLVDLMGYVKLVGVLTETIVCARWGWGDVRELTFAHYLLSVSLCARLPHVCPIHFLQ